MAGKGEEAVGREVVFATGGEPKEFRVGEGANEGRFFAFDYSDGFEWIGRQEMFTE